MSKPGDLWVIETKEQGEVWGVFLDGDIYGLDPLENRRACRKRALVELESLQADANLSNMSFRLVHYQGTVVKEHKR